MKKYRVYNIDWDCDNEEVRDSLPKEVIVDDNEDRDNTNYELSDFISDKISDIVGYCHRGCDYEVIEEEKLLDDSLYHRKATNLINEMKKDIAAAMTAKGVKVISLLNNNEGPVFTVDNLYCTEDYVADVCYMTILLIKVEDDDVLFATEHDMSYETREVIKNNDIYSPMAWEDIMRSVDNDVDFHQAVDYYDTMDVLVKATTTVAEVLYDVMEVSSIADGSTINFSADEEPKEEVKKITLFNIIEKLSDMESEDVLNVYAHETDGGSLAMGVEKHQVMDGLHVFLCNVYGSNSDFHAFPFRVSDELDEETYMAVSEYFFDTARALCGDKFSHLSFE